MSEEKKAEQMTLHRFDGMQKFATHVEAAQTSPDWVMNCYEVNTSINSDKQTAFSGAKSLDHALDLARLGWPAGLATMQAARATMPRANATGAARDYDVAGMYPDAARAAAGDPCAMVTPTAGELRGKSVICLVLQGSVSWQVDADSIATQAASICSLVDALEASDSVRVELLVHHGTGDGADQTMHVLTTLKAAEDALDLARLAGALSPSTYRRLFFRMIEAHIAPEWAKNTRSGYGIPRQADTIPNELPASALLVPAPNNRADATPAKSWESLTRWASDNGLSIEAA